MCEKSENKTLGSIIFQKRQLRQKIMKKHIHKADTNKHIAYKKPSMHLVKLINKSEIIKFHRTEI